MNPMLLAYVTSMIIAAMLSMFMVAVVWPLPETTANETTGPGVLVNWRVVLTLPAVAVTV